MAEKNSDQRNTVDEEEGGFDDVEAALNGINMLLNNGFEEALGLFGKYKDESPLMHAGFSFVYFMQALMSFEEDKVSRALKALQETEKRCESSDGFMKSVKRKFSRKKKSVEVLKTEDRLQRQVIVADSLLYQAILVFTNQDVPSYIKGGWHLRKAWKIYDKLHTHICLLTEKLSMRKIANLECEKHGMDPHHNPATAAATADSTAAASPASAAAAADTDLASAVASAGTSADERSRKGSMCRASSQSSLSVLVKGKATKESMLRASSQSSLLSSFSSSSSAAAAKHVGSERDRRLSMFSAAVSLAELSEETVGRLLGAVNFGYGAFQLCVSMVPPRVLKLTQFLGFQADRHKGLACLHHTSHSRDMKAPLATLALLWYHTVLRPFFALDGVSRLTHGTQEAEAIIREKEADFPNSSLFFFFRGRIHRLRREGDKSYEMYMRAFEEAKGQREIELMCLYEISWYNLMKLNWDKGAEGFQRLQRDSKWSKSYYSYLIAVCLGAQGKTDDASAVFRDLPTLVKRKNNQIETFVARRAERMRRGGVGQAHCQLLVLELIFLWHSLPSCSQHYLQQFLRVCELQTDPAVLPLKYLLEGALYREMDQEDRAIQCLKECVALHQGRTEDIHVAAFALYELATIYMKSPSTKAVAKEHLQRIKDHYKDYDFDNRLSVRVNNSLKQLKKGSRGSSAV